MVAVAVVGAGPSGSVAALALARAGHDCLLIDKVSFPRPKACGDLIGPLGVTLLDHLGIEVPGIRHPADVRLIGPTGRSVTLPAPASRSLAGDVIACPRSLFDATLRDAAIEAGAQPEEARVDAVVTRPAGVELRTDDGRTFVVDTVVAADGARSRIARSLGLVDEGRVLWGYAARAYLEQPVELPTILFWEPRERRAFPGYGWAFPASTDGANVGLGIGAVRGRAAGALAARVTTEFPAFLEHLRRIGAIDRRSEPGPIRAGWLKMGVVGTRPATDRVLLVGDAAGLVNPLQGEGIANGMRSALVAAAAISEDGPSAGRRYTAALCESHLPFHQLGAAAHRSMVNAPAAMSLASRVLTSRGVGAAMSRTWSSFWADLADQTHGCGGRLASTMNRVGGVASAATADGQWFRDLRIGLDPERSRRPYWRLPITAHEGVAHVD